MLKKGGNTKEMSYLKRLYGKTVIDSSDSDELAKDYKMELEYYQIEKETDSKPYGIKIVKKNVENYAINIEEKVIENICDNEEKASKILNILVSGKVTPIGADDILDELRKAQVIWITKSLVFFLERYCKN